MSLDQLQRWRLILGKSAEDDLRAQAERLPFLQQGRRRRPCGIQGHRYGHEFLRQRAIRGFGRWRCTRRQAARPWGPHSRARLARPARAPSR